MRLSGLMLLAPEQVGRWYFVPDFEATTSPVTAPATAAGWADGGAGIKLCGVGTREFEDGGVAGLTTILLLLSWLFSTFLSITDCLPKPKDAPATKMTKAL